MSANSLPLPTLMMLGLDQSNPFHVAGYMVASDLYSKGQIPQFDPSIIMLIIEILQMILPLLEEYCPADASEIAANAASLGPFQRWRWFATIRARTIRAAGRRGWAEVGAYSFADALVRGAAENRDNIVGRLLLACG